jgi:hypothetical protein
MFEDSSSEFLLVIGSKTASFGLCAVLVIGDVVSTDRAAAGVQSWIRPGISKQKMSWSTYFTYVRDYDLKVGRYQRAFIVQRQPCGASVSVIHP